MYDVLYGMYHLRADIYCISSSGSHPTSHLIAFHDQRQLLVSIVLRIKARSSVYDISPITHFRFVS